MNKRIKLKIVIAASTIVILGLIISIALTGCPQSCPDNSEDSGIGRCVPTDNK